MVEYSGLMLKHQSINTQLLLVNLFLKKSITLSLLIKLVFFNKRFFGEFFTSIQPSYKCCRGKKIINWFSIIDFPFLNFCLKIILDYLSSRKKNHTSKITRGGLIGFSIHNRNEHYFYFCVLHVKIKKNLNHVIS